MTEGLSNAQVDRLGERMREGPLDEADLTLLDEYCRSFGPSYLRVVGVLESLGLEPTGRPAKTTDSVVAKLHRESIRLSQIQDIAGCRLVVRDLEEQDRVVAALGGAFPDACIVDRRAKPSHGYRAIHVIIEVANRAVEIQVRTLQQDVWAELSEKLADVVEPAIKYGGGPRDVHESLSTAAAALGQVEEAERLLAEASRLLEQADQIEAATSTERMREFRDKVVFAKQQLPIAKEAWARNLRKAAEIWIGGGTEKL
jgi:GTP pyrophosphokinase